MGFRQLHIPGHREQLFWLNVNTFREISGIGVHDAGKAVHVTPESLPTH